MPVTRWGVPIHPMRRSKKGGSKRLVHNNNNNNFVSVLLVVSLWDHVKVSLAWTFGFFFRRDNIANGQYPLDMLHLLVHLTCFLDDNKAPRTDVRQPNQGTPFQDPPVGDGKRPFMLNMKNPMRGAEGSNICYLSNDLLCWLYTPTLRRVLYYLIRNLPRVEHKAEIKAPESVPGMIASDFKRDAKGFQERLDVTDASIQTLIAKRDEMEAELTSVISSDRVRFYVLAENRLLAAPILDQKTWDAAASKLNRSLPQIQSVNTNAQAGALEDTTALYSDTFNLFKSVVRQKGGALEPEARMLYNQMHYQVNMQVTYKATREIDQQEDQNHTNTLSFTIPQKDSKSASFISIEHVLNNEENLRYMKEEHLHSNRGAQVRTYQWNRPDVLMYTCITLPGEDTQPVLMTLDPIKMSAFNDELYFIMAFTIFQGSNQGGHYMSCGRSLDNQGFYWHDDRDWVKKRGSRKDAGILFQPWAFPLFSPVDGLIRSVSLQRAGITLPPIVRVEEATLKALEQELKTNRDRQDQLFQANQAHKAAVQDLRMRTIRPYCFHHSKRSNTCASAMLTAIYALLYTPVMNKVLCVSATHLLDPTSVLQREIEINKEEVKNLTKKVQTATDTSKTLQVITTAESIFEKWLFLAWGAVVASVALDPATPIGPTVPLEFPSTTLKFRPRPQKLITWLLQNLAESKLKSDDEQKLRDQIRVHADHVKATATVDGKGIIEQRTKDPHVLHFITVQPGQKPVGVLAIQDLLNMFVVSSTAPMKLGPSRAEHLHGWDRTPQDVVVLMCQTPSRENTAPVRLTRARLSIGFENQPEYELMSVITEVHDDKAAHKRSFHCYGRSRWPEGFWQHDPNSTDQMPHFAENDVQVTGLVCIVLQRATLAFGGSKLALTSHISDANMAKLKAEFKAVDGALQQVFNCRVQLETLVATTKRQRELGPTLPRR